MSATPDRAYLCECFNYDPATGLLVWKQRPQTHFMRAGVNASAWNRRFAGKVTGCPSPPYGQLVVSLAGKTYLAHRIIWKMMTGTDALIIDHIDNDPHNNRWSNLRSVTASQSAWNMRGKKGRSLPKGVFRNGSGWTAQIRAYYGRHCLGTYATIEEAKSAYDAAAALLHGEFSNTG